MLMTVTYGLDFCVYKVVSNPTVWILKVIKSMHLDIIPNVANRKVFVISTLDRFNL